MTDAQWYEDMAAAMKRRDHAKKMVDRWQVGVTEAEAEILDLTNNQNTPDTPERTLEQEPTNEAE